MHPLHDYIAHQVAERLKSCRVVVMYDPRRELAAFFDEACSGMTGDTLLRDGAFEGRKAKVCSFQGSYLQVRSVVEPLTSGDDTDDLVVYLPDETRVENTSLLLEIEKAGVYYAQPALKQIARNVLRKRFTDVDIDEMLQSDGLSYSDLARMSQDTGAGDGASVLKNIFGDSDTRITITTWVTDENRDSDIDQKGAVGELRRTIQSRIGLELPEGTTLAKMRAHATRYVLGNEFRLGLKAQPPSSLAALPAPGTKDQEFAVQYIAAKLRETRGGAPYELLADQAQAELGLTETSVASDALGTVDTFRFEERAVVAKCFELIAADSSSEASALLDVRGQSFWVDRQPSRKAVWEACRLMIEMGRLAGEVAATIAKANGKPQQWVERYVAAGPEGWYRLDQAQRRLETLLAAIEDEDISDAAINWCRSKYDEIARRQAEGFVKVFEKAGWTIPEVLPQHRFWSEVVANMPKPLAVVAVDAMRYEIGAELADRLGRSGEVKLRPAIADLPSITPIGMAAILPGAASGFSIAEKNGRFGAMIGDTFLPDLTARKSYLHAQVPGIVDVTLDEVLTWKSTTQKKIEGAQIVFVRSSEIDAAGENADRYARRIMEGTVGDVARCLNKLAGAGIENAVVTADHGHLYFASERDESMRIPSPGGKEADLHRRCWIGKGGATPPGAVRISGPKLGYATDLDIVVPASVSVFKAGGDLAYHHGGASLQELVIPVITARLRAPTTGSAEKKAVSANFAAEAVTNRIFVVEIALGNSAGGMFAEPRRVRPVAVVGSSQVASAKMTKTGPVEDGEIMLEPNKSVTVGMILADDSISALRIQVLDADTDAVLYQSPNDIPVRLTM